MELLDHDMPDPKPYLSISLVLSSLNDYCFSPSRDWGADTIEIDDALLNPGVKDIRALPRS